MREQNKDAIYLTYWDNQLRETTSMDTEIGWLSVHVDAIKHFMLKQKRERAWTYFLENASKKSIKDLNDNAPVT